MCLINVHNSHCCDLDLPDISVAHSNLTVLEGGNVTLSCNGSGFPVPEVDWTVNGLHSINTHQVSDIHLTPNTPFNLIFCLTIASCFWSALQSNVYWPNIHSINLTLVNVSRDDNGFVLTCISENVVGMTNVSLQLAVLCTYIVFITGFHVS